MCCKQRLDRQKKQHPENFRGRLSVDYDQGILYDVLKTECNASNHEFFKLGGCWANQAAARGKYSEAVKKVSMLRPTWYICHVLRPKSGGPF